MPRTHTHHCKLQRAFCVFVHSADRAQLDEKAVRGATHYMMLPGLGNKGSNHLGAGDRGEHEGPQVAALHSIYLLT